MPKIYRRTENGTETLISVSEALAEANHAMMAGRREVRSMSSVHGRHWIEYKDGRNVRLEMEDAPDPIETDSRGRRIIEAKGKRYIVGAIVPARPKVEGVPTWSPEAYVSYWTERNGEIFGATRFAGEHDKPGTVGRAIWDAISV